MPGPLPSPQTRRRNAPTIAGTELPAEGRKGRTPKCPYELGPAGATWWKWAWRLPQATRWDAGSMYAVARRAQLEDEMAELDSVDALELVDMASDPDLVEIVRRVAFIVGQLKARAGGAVTLMREMR